MVKTENRIDLLTETFHNKLELDKLYSRSEIEDLMDKKMDHYYNVTALTYNRWNKGMNFVCPLLEHTDRGTYRYLGADYPYNGILSHFPQGQYEEYIIGKWDNGVLKFTNPNIRSFKDWVKSDDNGERMVSVGSKVTVLRGGHKEFKFLLSDESGGITDGYGHVSTESKLGQLIKGTTKGSTFEFGGLTHEVISIE